LQEDIVQSVDPITFEILSHRLYQVAKEMGTTLERVGGTVNTTQIRDYMAALYLANGEILSAGETMGWHVPCAGFAVRTIMERFGEDGGIAADDVFLLNDPYLAAIHQSDLYMISPIHYDGRLVGWSATFVHVMDIGAMSPGGNSPGATEIFHEGVRIPGIKLVDRGELRRDVFDTITNMTRQPVMVGLDLKCEMAANHVAKVRMQEMYANYGTELMEAVSQEMIRYAESVLRGRIAEIPDGSWTDEGVIQADESWRVRVTLHKRGDSLRFDFTGSDPQASKGINLPYHSTLGGCYEAMIHTLGYDVPKNQGALKPIEVIAPAGTVVNVRYPAPVSLNTTSAGATVKFVAYSVLMQMMATSEKWNTEVMALNAGHRLARHAGVNQHGTYYVSTLAEGALDGSGARSQRDGRDSGHGSSTCHNVEWVELNFPLLYLFRRHTKDAAGAGQFRGGVGSESALTVYDAPEGKVRVIALGAAGLRNSGQGMFGGYPGAPSILVWAKGTKVREMWQRNECPQSLVECGGQSELLAYYDFDLAPEDVLYLRMSNGGGYGDPLERDPEWVQRDLELGFISTASARSIYGVVVHEKSGVVDREATRSLRKLLLDERLRESS